MVIECLIEIQILKLVKAIYTVLEERQCNINDKYLIIFGRVKGAFS